MSPSICWQSWAACNEYTSQWAVARDERTARGSRIRWTTLAWIQIVILLIFVRPCLYVTLGDPRLQILFPGPNCLDHPQIGGLALAWSSHCDIRPLSRPLQSCYFREKLWRTIVETIQGALCWVHCRQRWSIPVKGRSYHQSLHFKVTRMAQKNMQKLCRQIWALPWGKNQSFRRPARELSLGSSRIWIWTSSQSSSLWQHCSACILPPLKCVVSCVVRFHLYCHLSCCSLFFSWLISRCQCCRKEKETRRKGGAKACTWYILACLIRHNFQITGLGTIILSGPIFPGQMLLMAVTAVTDS